MKKTILKYIYVKNRKFFHDIFVEDLLLSIPDEISKPALDLLAERKKSVTKWLFFEANSIYRRPVTDFHGAERRNGMLIMIQALLMAVGARERKVEEHPTVGETVAPPDDWKKHIDGFQEGAKKLKNK